MAARFAVVLAQPITGEPPTAQEAVRSLELMTHTVFDDDWSAVAQRQDLLTDDSSAPEAEQSTGNADARIPAD